MFIICRKLFFVQGETETFYSVEVMVLYNADLSGMVGNRDGIKPGGMDFKLRKRRAERIAFPSFLNA